MTVAKRAIPLSLAVALASGLGPVSAANAVTTCALVLDINPGASNGVPLSSSPSELTIFGGRAFFDARSGTAWGIWKSDGTDVGTMPAADPGGEDLTNGGTRLFFVGPETDPAQAGGGELWKTDGTQNGTVMVKDINPYQGSSPSDLTMVGSTLFFQAEYPTTGSELWRSDGTSNGTKMVRNIATGTMGSNPSDLTNVSGTLFFSANSGSGLPGLWKSDGTAAGTVKLKTLWNISALTAVGRRLFFVANDGTHGQELWKSDGTKAGTVMVRDIASGSASATPRNLFPLGGSVFFVANNVLNPYTLVDLWKTDGTKTGTVLLRTRVASQPGGYSNAVDIYPTKLNGTLLFAGSSSNGVELWKSNGTKAGTIQIKDIYLGAGSSSPMDIANVGGSLVFSAYDPIHGRELWQSDGTGAGTKMVTDIYPGLGPDSNPGNSLPSDFVTSSGHVYFSADDGTHGRELWACTI
jgi:ELWxxDGT repeat protein